MNSEDLPTPPIFNCSEHLELGTNLTKTSVLAGLGQEKSTLEG